MNKNIYSYALNLIARQDYSEYKLRQKLRSKQYIPHEIDETIEALKVKGFIKEDNYRRLFIRKWMMKGESEDKIRQRGSMEKLTFEDDEFQNVSEELGFSDDDSLEKLIEKKLRSKEIPTDPAEKYKLRDKVLRYLISKGHDFQSAKKALSQFI